MPSRIIRSHTDVLIPRPTHDGGFTLIELAVSMLIITLLATVLLTPITTQVTQARMSQAKTDLDQINEALIGFALAQSKPYLPCPDTTGDGVADACAITTTTASEGNIPWVTLNVPAMDPWGQRYQYRVNNAFTNSVAGFTLTTAPTGAACAPPGNASGFIKICGSATVATCNASILANGIPAVMFSYGPNGQIAATSPDELENRDLDCLLVSRTYSSATGVEFDDLLVWLSPGVLMSRMVTAQKLP
jgi:prepilin-type N-terminal cleavage/methylation domain-containing protein